MTAYCCIYTELKGETEAGGPYRQLSLRSPSLLDSCLWKEFLHSHQILLIGLLPPGVGFLPLTQR